MRRRVLGIGVAGVVLAALVVQPGAPGPVAAALVEPVRVCGNVAPGPLVAPPGDVVVIVPSGDVAQQNLTYVLRSPGIIAYFEAGVHTLGPGQFDQIIPGDNSQFIGAPGAVLDGRGINRYAFTQHATNVTIRHLEIRGFVPPNDEGVVNHDSGNGWVIADNWMHHNRGAAIMAGANQVVRGNCFADNGQYAMNAYQAGNGITGLVFEANEVVGNATDGEPYAGCGCTGGAKFWAVNGADIRGNWVHHNHGPGVWADTNNNDFLIENNLIEANDGMGIFYEISYNAVIRGNTIRDNAWVQGREFAARGDPFPIGAIYLSEAGGEPRIPARTDKLEITGNDFVNNWGGVVGWENSDRFCGVNTTADCTLLARTSQCVQPGIASEPLYGDCRWKTQHLNIHHNTFSHDPAAMGCTAFCGRSALFANWGTWPDWSPYHGNVVQQAITFGQDNSWHDNTYLGPWRFVPVDTGHDLSSSEWQASPYGQDAGSSFDGATPAPTSSTTATTTPAPTTTTVAPTTTAPTTTAKTKPPCR